jgi:serpin B
MRQPDRLKKIGGAACVLLVTLAALGGCGGGSAGAPQTAVPSAPVEKSSLPPAVADAVQADTAVNPLIVTADNAFGLSLLDTLNQTPTENIAISPLSIALVLQIMYNGAAGATQQVMAQSLQLQGLAAADLDNDNAALQASLVNPDPQVQLTIANSLWMHLSANPVLPSFIQANQTYYGAEIGDLSGAPANVNAWVSSNTNGLITQILPPQGNYATVVAVIANALYFKGAWTVQFDPSHTTSAAFTLSDGSQSSCQMMHQSGSYAYFKGANFQALRIPYGNDRLSMLILLPDSGVDLSAFIAGITTDDLNTWISQLQTSSGVIALTRFTSTYGASLPPALSSLGMGIAFSPASANFSGIAPNTYISDIEHKTVVEVDETGTVAAAATSGSVGVTATGTSSFTMTMDHPFFYAIQDDKTGALLFIGALANPT